MKKLVMLVVALVSVVMVSNSYAAVDSSEFVEICQTGALAAVSSALQNGADVNAIAADGTSALMGACQNSSSSSLAIVALLLQKGADVNTVNTLGKSALDYAKENTKYGQKISTVLEKAGAVATVVKTVKNSSATASEMATAAATAAAIKVATSEEGVSTKEIAETAVQAAEETAAANQKEEVKQEEPKQEEGGFFSKIKSWFSWK